MTDWRKVRLVALDFETTGLDPKRDDVLSVGAVGIQGGRVRLGDSLYRVVDPGRPVPPDVVRIHGIRPADLLHAPPLESVREELDAFIGSSPLVVWTAWVEAAFLARTMGASRRAWARRLIDVRYLAVRVDGARGITPSPAWRELLSETVSRMGLPLEIAHNALGDALMTAQLMIVYAHILGPDLSSKALREMGRRAPQDRQ